MKFTSYFKYMIKRPDRGIIKIEWLESAIRDPVHSEIQSDGRIRKWKWIEEEKKYLRVILLPDGETIHNAFFDRRFKGGSK